MTHQELLNRVKAILRGVHARRLRGVVLYGSHARGAGKPDSDIDLLVLLDGPIHYGRDLLANLDALYPLAVDLQRRISAKPVDAKEYETAQCPLYENAHREGIAARSSLPRSSGSGPGAPWRRLSNFCQVMRIRLRRVRIMPRFTPSQRSLRIAASTSPHIPPFGRRSIETSFTRGSGRRSWALRSTS